MPRNQTLLNTFAGKLHDMTQEKLKFIKETFPALLRKLKGDEQPVWGKMNAIQMVEHMGASFRQADAKNNFSIVTPSEQLQAFKSFMMSEKEFRPNTKNVLLGEYPAPAVFSSMKEAIKDLESAIAEFIRYFEKNPEKATVNPVFGVLNFDEWVQLLHKHAIHHLKQFSLM